MVEDKKNKDDENRDDVNIKMKIYNNSKNLYKESKKDDIRYNINNIGITYYIFLYIDVFKKIVLMK